MSKIFFSNIIFMVLLNLLVKTFYLFGIDRTVQEITQSDYGIYFALLKVVFVFNILLDFGIENYTRKKVAEKPESASTNFPGLMGIKLTLGILFATICILFGTITGDFNRHPEIYILLVFNQFLNSLILFLRANLGGLHLFKTDSVLSVLDRFLTILICGLLIIWQPSQFKILWYIMAQTIAYSVSVIIALVQLKKHVQKLSFNFNMNDLKTQIIAAWPYALLVFTMGIYYHADAFLIHKLAPEGHQAVNIYAKGARIIEALNNFALLFGVILIPIFSKMLANKEDVSKMVSSSWTLLFIPAITFTIGTFTVRNEIMDFLYPTLARESAEVYAWLIFSFLGMCITYIFGSLITASGNLKPLILMSLSAAAINITLNISLIGSFGVKGAAISALITQAYTSFFHIILGINKHQLKINRSIINILLYTISNVAIFGSIQLIDLNWVFKIILGTITALTLALITKMIHLQDFTTILKRNHDKPI